MSLILSGQCHVPGNGLRTIVHPHSRCQDIDVQTSLAQPLHLPGSNGETGLSRVSRLKRRNGYAL
jgi:hypothetical protein